MSPDALTLLVLFGSAVSCSAAVLLGEQLYRCLTKQSHGDRPDSDDICGDWPRVPDDLKSFFHKTGDTL